jgi:methyltransferase (TIGR00027 family)
MQTGQPSRTALGAAGHRAAHQVIEQGSIFSDPLALRILGADAETQIEEARQDPRRRGLRLFIAVRTRFAEDALARAVEQGARQLVVLGAGLDTYAYRTTLGDRLRIFEVDHPATQEWKRARLAQAMIAPPPALTFAPIDFERDTLAQGLAATGFDIAQPSFFTWLGTVPYLTETAIFATLGFIAGLPGGAHVVFDYANPPDTIADAKARAAHEALRDRVAAAGESLKTYFVTDSLRKRLADLGYRSVEDLNPSEIAARYYPNGKGSTSRFGGHVIRASTI